MQIHLNYGRGTVPLNLPDEAAVTVIRKPVMPVLPDPVAGVLNALLKPVEAPSLVSFARCETPGADGWRAPPSPSAIGVPRSLAELARGRTTACIAICDITRPVPNHLFLRPMIETLLHAGVPAAGITVLVATGLHRPNEGAELAELVGDPWVLETVKVENHFARNDADHVNLGRTRTRGTVVRLDRRFVEADLRIATGLVEPHFMAGYSGGRKVIAPGLAHAETITTFHSGRFMADVNAANCNFESNPLHEEQLEIVRMLGGALALNTVLDEHRRLSFVNFGEILTSHAEAVRVARQFCEVRLPRRFHTVVTSAAGYPLDKTYYQTVKGMVGAMEILEPGGDLIIASECSEGIGSAEFLESQQRLVRLGADTFLSSLLSKSHAAIDEWQTQMQLKPQAIGNVHLYSDKLPAAHQSATGVTMAPSLDEAVRSSLDRSPDKAVAVIPEGPYVVPFFGNGTTTPQPALAMS